MKINTNQIPNFDELPEETKNAILEMDIAEAPDMSDYVSKVTFDKTASDLAAAKKALREKQTSLMLSIIKEATEEAIPAYAEAEEVPASKEEEKVVE